MNMVFNMKNERLEKVLKYIEPSDLLADVGCDHGYLAIMAIEKGVSFVELIDNKKGPLDTAKKNLLSYEDKAKIIYSLSSGISDLKDEINTVAICGMGGELISQILDSDIDVAMKIDKFILQPNSKQDFLRAYLNKKNFIIQNEEIVLDNDKIYEIIVCNYEIQKVQYDELDILFGPVLRNKKEPLFIKKWTDKLNHNLNILSKIDNEHVKYSEIKKEVELIKEVLYES